MTVAALCFPVFLTVGYWVHYSEHEPDTGFHRAGNLHVAGLRIDLGSGSSPVVLAAGESWLGGRQLAGPFALGGTGTLHLRDFSLSGRDVEITGAKGHVTFSNGAATLESVSTAGRIFEEPINEAEITITIQNDGGIIYHD